MSGSERLVFVLLAFSGYELDGCVLVGLLLRRQDGMV